MGRQYLYFWFLCLGLGAGPGTLWAQLLPNCPIYVEEGHDLKCTCIYKTSTPPVYTPYFSWLGHSNTTDLVKLKVGRADNGTVFTCVMVMGSQTSTVNYVLQVVYGPRDSDVTIIPQQPIPVNGSNPVTLTCLATEVNPQPTFTWSGLTCAEGNHDDTCTFTPTLPGDNDKSVTCTVQNTYRTSGVDTASKTVTLKFYYSPSSTPTTTTATTTTMEKMTTIKMTTTTITTDTSPSSSATTASSTTVMEKTTAFRPTTTTIINTSPLSGATTPHSSASSSHIPSEPPPSTSPTTADVSSTEDVTMTTDVDQFPMAAFAGGLAAAFVFILLLILIIVLCQRKRERDVTLMRSANHLDGSYKNSAAKDFYSYDNNGYDQDGMTETPDSPHKNNHHHQPSSSSLSKTSSRHIDMERALGFYQSVPTVTPHANGSSQREEPTEGTNNGHTELQDDFQEQSERGVEIVRFENPSYSLTPHSSSAGTQPDGGTLPTLGTQPQTEVHLDCGTGPDEGTQLDWGTQPDSGTQPDWGAQPVSETPADHENVASYIYAEVNKPKPATSTEDADLKPDSNHTDGDLDDEHAPPPHSDCLQHVEVTSYPSTTIITLTNNHNVCEDGTDNRKMYND